jgi:outer membrane protein assembly factor BamA
MILGTVSASAQETRAGLIVEKQEAKAKELKPYEPEGAERALAYVQERFLQPRPSGFFPYFDSVYGGGGFTLGAGYRKAFGDQAQWNVKGLYSIRNYKKLEFETISPGHMLDRLTLGARVGYRDATQVAYYGLGPDTSPDDRANYRFKQGYGGVGAEFLPVSWVRLFGEVFYEDFDLLEGQGSAPSIEEMYTLETAPGLGDSPAFVHATAAAGIDWRTSPGYTRTGGYYGVEYQAYVDPDDIYSFNLVTGTLIQHLPILRENWVLSLRGEVTTTVDDNDLVPYFLLPSLGSGSTLRAYSSWRFRDRHSMLTSAEWRWIPSRLGMDMAFFFDAGKVVPTRSQLDFNDLKTDYGVGLRLHGPNLTVFRFDVANGSEGWNLVFAAGAPF